MRTLFFNEAINEAIKEEMERDPNVFIMGEDVATYGGVFKVTKGLLEQFGPERVRDTAISEAAILGAGIGAAVQGMRPIVEIMFADFIPISMDRIVNEASQLHFISGGSICVPMVIRTAEGIGSYYGPQHSKNLEAWFTHIPGIKVLAPSMPYDAKGLLKSAVRDDNPVILFENKALYKTTGEVPDGEYTVEIGRADIKRHGKDISIITWSRMVHESLNAANELASEGINAEVLDLRTLSPLDENMVYESVKNTNRAIVVHEAWKNSGYGAEVVARIQENVFDHLDAPIIRVAGLDTPIPFSPALQNTVVPNTKDIIRAVRKVLRK